MQFLDADEKWIAPSSALNLVIKKSESWQQQRQQHAERAAAPSVPPPPGAPQLPCVQPAAAAQPTPRRQALEDGAGGASEGPIFIAGDAVVQEADKRPEGCEPTVQNLAGFAAAGPKFSGIGTPVELKNLKDNSGLNCRRGVAT